MGTRIRLRTPALALAIAAMALGTAASGASATTTLGGVQPPVSGGTGPPVLPSASGPEVAGTSAVVIRGLAYAPSRAPVKVKQVIWAANKIRHRPYKWGGGHGSWKDTGYDCSGSVSYALHGGGLLASPLDSRGFIPAGDDLA